MEIVLKLMEFKFFYLIITALGFLALVAGVLAWRQDRSYRKGSSLIKELLDDNAHLKQEVLDLRVGEGKLKEDLVVKDQMYSGLKEQYDELEKDFEKLNAGKT
jgi:hypothetical protein